MNRAQSNYPDDWEKIISGQIIIERDVKVFSKSCFSDGVWDFTDNVKLRNTSVSQCSQRIHWEDFESCFTCYVIA